MNVEAIVKACRATAEAANEALVWIGDSRNTDKLSVERPTLERSLRRAAFQARTLEKSTDRPMSVGVFGPSQAGKSYLISVLARKGSTLIARFDDPTYPEIDFIREINPSGGKEATGLVTRFSIHPAKTPPGYPVALRLLSQTEMTKILANAYGNDGDPAFEDPLESNTIEDVLGALQVFASTNYTDQLREEDIWDLQDYFQTYLKRFYWVGKFDPYWDRIAALAPRLSIEKRAELYSLFWGRHKELTKLYFSLVSALSKLGFPDDAYCQLDALVPSTSSILNVDTLKGMLEDRGDSLRVASGTTAVDLPRCIVTALIAELRIHAKEKPWDFFDYIDLLDFPGYRSRNLFRLKTMFESDASTTVQEMFLRGKVDFLFQRYTADQELTSVLLCLKDSNLEVKTLPSVIDQWIAVTHGSTAEERNQKKVLLFFILTFFDVHLIDRASEKEASQKAARFQARMHASLLDPFGKASNDWPNKWTPDQPFRNCYWIRNPNIKSEGIIEYDGFREVRILPAKINDLAELKSSYLSVPEVQQHFREPARAWDEVMKLNDGGIGYLAENLAKVCLPEMKSDQVRSRLAAIRKQMFDQLSRYYISTDLDQRLKDRLAITKEILRDIDRGLRTRKRFGSMIRGLCIDRVQLSDALFEARSRVNSGDEQLAQLDAGIDPDYEMSLEDIFENDGGRSVNAAEPRFLGLGNVAVQTWVRHMHGKVENEHFAKAVGMRSEMLREMIAEITGAAKRLRIAELLAKRIDEMTHIENNDAIVAKASLICEQIINRFVATLGYDSRPYEERPVAPLKGQPPRPVFSNGPPTYDCSGIGIEPIPFGFHYAVDWFAAFQQVVRENASTEGGSTIDPEQNRKLGNILDRMQTAL